MTVNTSTVNWPRIGGHNMTVDGFHLFQDFGLAAREIVRFQPPKKKEQRMDIPGRDGELDLYAESPAYQNRRGTLRFYALIQSDSLGDADEYGRAFSRATASYREGLKARCIELLQGGRKRIILDDDPDFYYTGTFTVTEWVTKETHAEVTVDYDIDPYKLYIDSSLSRALVWDKSNIIYEGYAIPSRGRSIYVVNPAGQIATADVTVSADMTLTLSGGGTQTLYAGTVNEVTLAAGLNALNIAGYGRVNFVLQADEFEGKRL